MYSIGNLVSWTSSSNGSTTKKTGLVEAVIKPSMQPNRAQQKESGGYGAARKHESYLIRVPGKGPEGKLYWPRVSLLQPAEANQNTRSLKPKGRVVSELNEAVQITLTTKCPAKWAMVDRETGEIWGHDGVTFQRIAGRDAVELALVVGKSARKL